MYRGQAVAEGSSDEIAQIRRNGLGVLLIEQNLDFAFAMAERGYVMEKRQIVLEAPVADLRGGVAERYLTF